MINSDIRSHFSNKTVLLVEDEEAIISILKDLFSAYRVNIYEADNGQHAVEVLMDNDIDYIITDYLMPKMNGLQLIDWVRTNYSKKIPVVILTGSVLNALEYQVDDNTMVIYKPFIFKEIINSLVILNTSSRNAAK